MNAPNAFQQDKAFDIGRAIRRNEESCPSGLEDVAGTTERQYQGRKRPEVCRARKGSYPPLTRRRGSTANDPIADIDGSSQNGVRERG